MRRKQHLVMPELQARRVFTDEMPEMQKTLRFVEGDPMRHTIREPIRDHGNVVGKPFGAVSI